MRKQIFSVVMIVALVLGLMPLVPIEVKADTYNEDGFVLENLYLGGVALVGYEGDEADITIPSKVTVIKESAFKENTTLNRVVIPDAVEKIENYAFYKCTNLTSVDMPKNVELSSWIFKGCENLKSLTIEEGTTTVWDAMSSLEAKKKDNSNDCGATLEAPALETITFAAGLDKVPSHLCFDCDELTTINWNDDIESIETLAFDKCEKLGPEITVPANVTKLEHLAFGNCKGLKNITLQGLITRLPSYCFLGCRALESFTMTYQNELETVGESAFACCEKLTECPISATKTPRVTRIPMGCFDECSSITEIELSEKLEFIGSGAFSETGITSVDIPENVEFVASSAFANCEALVSATIPEKTKFIPNTDNYDRRSGTVSGDTYCSNIFSGCTSLTTFTIPSSWTVIPTSMFLGCTSFETVQLNENDSITHIGTATFKNTKITSIDWPAELKYIGNEAFSGSKLVSASLPNKLVTISNSTFAECNELENVLIPKSVKVLGTMSSEGRCFKNCKKLKNVTFEAESELNTMRSEVFYGCSALEEIDMSECTKLDVLGMQSFGYCSSLKEIKLPANLTEMQGYDFYECTSLEGVDIPNSVTEMGSMEFVNCKKLSQDKVSIPETVSLNGCSYMFKGCDSFTDLPELGTTTEISYSMFDSCLGLTKIMIPSQITSIASGGFQNCENLKIVGVPASVTNVDTFSFTGLADNSTIYAATQAVADLFVEKTYDLTKTKIKVGQPVDCNHEGEHCTVVVPASETEDGEIQEICKTCNEVVDSTVINKVSDITLSVSSYIYDGKTKSPSIKVKDSKGNTISKTDYTVKKASGRKNVGEYKYTVTFKNNYKGTAERSFKINPKKTSISKVTAAKKSFKITWKKISSQATGYQIQYATDSKYTKSCKTVTVSSYKTTSKTIKSLKAKKKYYVRVRTYKTVSGKKYYSGWTSSKSIKTK